MTTNVYIDGFNLYYGALRGTPYKWLDLDTLFRLMYPRNTIQTIKYFTAHVGARPDDPDQPTRQQTYLRALRTFPNMEIITGHFLTNKVRMRLVAPPVGGPNTAEVWKTEEKGSDVNLAIHLLNDAYQKSYDVALVVSNDSDLSEAIRIVTQDLGLKVGVVFPTGAINLYTRKRNKPKKSKTLQQYATFLGETRKGVLSQSLLPPTLTDAAGTFSKPPTW